MTIKAIETRYAGCHFRSRLEARWAVFFDHMKIEWQYEPQGFELPSGRYLPDFKVSTLLREDDDRKTWIEVKGQRATTSERNKAEELALHTGDPVIMLEGDIPRSPSHAVGFSLTGVIYGISALNVNPLRGNWATDLWVSGSGLEDALTAARSARFEHGQSGVR